MERNKLLSITLLTAVLLIFIGAMLILTISNRDFSLKQNENRIVMGAVYMTLNNPFYQIIDEEMRTQIENRGDILLTRNPSLDVERQKEEVQELINKGIRVLFINPVDADSIAPALEIAHAADIPVIAIDTNVADDNLVYSTVVSDNYLAGAQCAHHLLNNAQSGNIALLTHSHAKSAIDRINGFMDAIKNNPSFTIVDQEECLGQLELAMPAMEKMLQRHPEINIVMALNDPAAMGAMAALKNANKLNGTLVYGVDGSPEAKDMIINGMMTASAGQQPRKIGQLAVVEAYKIIEGKEAEHTVIKLPTVLLTHENIYNMNEVGY